MTNSKMSVLHIPVQLKKQTINTLMKREFKPIEMAGNQTIENLEIDGLDQEMIIYLDMTGSLSGRIKASFIPSFDLPNQKIELNEFKANLMKTGFLSKGLNWMMDSFLKDNIQSKVQEILDKQLAKLFDNYINETHKIPIPNQLSTEILIKALDIQNFKFSEADLLLDIELSGFIKLISNADFN